MSTVLRISSDSTNTDFDETEVPVVSIRFVQGIDLYSDRAGYYFFYRRHNRYKLFTITFDLDQSDTITKLNTIYEYIQGAETWGIFVGNLRQPKVIQLYYEYLIDTDSNCWVQMYREDMVWPYATGEASAKDKIKIRFIETLPEGVAAIDVARALGG